MTNTQIETSAEPVRAPLQRFFARMLDFALYRVLWDAFLALVCGVNLALWSRGAQPLDFAAQVLLMLAIEPLLLSRFGTTLGKWIMGIHVADHFGGRLSYSAALSRTWTVLWRGMRCNIPFFRLVRLYKSCRACSDGQTLDWEYDSELSLRETHAAWRVAGYICACAACAGVLTLAFALPQVPRNRGDLTVAEFCENYNQLARHYKMENGYLLGAGGRWAEESDTAIVIDGGNLPEFVFTEEDGRMTGLHFMVEQRDASDIQSGYQDQARLAALAFVRAQPGGGLFSKEAVSAVQQIESAGLQDYCFTACGIEIQYEIRYSGYTAVESMNALWPQEGEQTYYAISFSMQKR